MTRVTVNGDTAVVEIGAMVFDKAVVRYLKERYGIYVSLTDAAFIIQRIGSAYPLPCELAMVFRGVLLTSEEVRDVLRTPLDTLVKSLRALSWKYDIQLKGKGAALRGLDLLLDEEIRFHL